jgi:hypothetical protein
MTAGKLWGKWRYRQRIEQYQDNQFCAGHDGYLDTSRRALIYTLGALKLPVDADIRRIMDGWQELMHFPSCRSAVSMAGRDCRCICDDLTRHFNRQKCALTRFL